MSDLAHHPDVAVAELQALAAELQASRTRIVEAGDEARRRIERDLHDGAQQRLVTASMLLGVAMRTVARGEADGVAEQLARVKAELDGGLAELRDLARGIHPTVLSDHGLRPAVDALVARSPVPVVVHGDLPERPAATVEATLYFTIAEALTNVAKYASAAEAVVTIGSGVEHAQVEIRDDGIGGADPAAGSGLRGLVDRLGALGGHLHVHSPPGAGTTVHAVVPLDPRQAAGDVACGCCAEGQCRCVA
ncbi:MAG TPA: histidine kinase [Solirubrobacteraceae bacterium]|nr:histidine kinase [Solirubrobacteraceae bacterium]